MKVVFLDIDGVMNHYLSHEEYESYDVEQVDIYDEHLSLLRRIIDETNAEIVLTSSWRIFPNSLSTVMDRLASFGMHLRGITDEGVDRTTLKTLTDVKQVRLSWSDVGRVDDRGAEILLWSYKHRDVLERAVVFDDETKDIEPYLNNDIFLIKTDYAFGLTKELADKAIRILNGEDE